MHLEGVPRVEDAASQTGADLQMVDANMGQLKERTMSFIAICDMTFLLLELSER
jgi:hypothetical protein